MKKCKLYRHFDAANRLLYVGISISILTRLNAHKINSCWFDDIARIEIENFPSVNAAAIAEMQAIKNEKPLYNVRMSKVFRRKNYENAKILTATQCAERVGVSVITWRHWHKQNRCPAKPIAGMKPPKWRSVDIEALAASGKVTATPKIEG